MATSAVQIQANRANAQLSTGPRSDEGKRASSSNSTTSGLTSAKIFVRTDEQAEFDQFESALLDELKPAGLCQLNFFELILHAAWNLRRCYLLETHIQNEAISKGLDDALLDDELARKLDRIYRYRKMHESSHRRAMADLRQLQSEQLWRQENQELQEESILTDTKNVAGRLRKDNAVEQRANLDVLRQHIEAFITPPPLARNHHQ
jgi:hypothetical protein